MLDYRQQQLLNWLSAPDPSTNFNRAKNQRHAETGTWFLESEPYSTWQNNPSASMWLHGLAGCGKTVLSSTIIRDLQEKSGENTVSTVKWERHQTHALPFLAVLLSLRLILPKSRYRHSPLGENTIQSAWRPVSRDMADRLPIGSVFLL